MMTKKVKILGICGSPRKAATEHALTVALEAAAAVPNVEVELVTLRGKKINFCIHCDKCIRENSLYCSLHKDDMTQELYDKFYEADGYIIASPVYEMNVSAQMATFFNRFRATYNVLKHQPDFFSRKVGAAIAVGGTRNGGQEMTIQAIHGFFHTQGIVPANAQLGVYSGASVWSQDRRAAGAKEDEIGMRDCQRLGQRMAELTLCIKNTTLPE